MADNNPFAGFEVPGATIDDVALVDAQTGNGEKLSLQLVPSIDAHGGSGQLVWGINDKVSAVAAKYRMMNAMLKDDWRNKQYQKAIEVATKRMHGTLGRAPTVIDLGAGTGLLSYLAASAGAEHVAAIEMNAAVAVHARAALQSTPQVQVIEVMSHDLPTPTNNNDNNNNSNNNTLRRPADLIVTETLDSLLLTEGIIPTLRDARKRLVHPGAAVVPCRAVIHAQIFSVSDDSCSIDKLAPPVAYLKPTTSNSFGLKSSQTNGGEPSRLSWQVAHVAELLAHPAIQPVTDAFQVFSFTFDNDDEFPETWETRVVKVPVTATESSRASLVVTWWELELQPGISIDTFPRSDDDALWQDHWKQAFAVLDSPILVGIGKSGTCEQIIVECTRTDTDVAITLVGDFGSIETGMEGSESLGKRQRQNELECRVVDLTLYCDVERRWQLGNEVRNCAWTTALSDALQRIVSSCSGVIRALDVSDGSLLGISLASLTQMLATHRTEVVSVDADLQSKRMFQSLWDEWDKNNNINNNDLSTPTSIQCSRIQQDISSVQNSRTSFIVANTLEEAKSTSTSTPTSTSTSSTTSSITREPFNVLVSELHYRTLRARPLLGAINFWHQAKALRASGVLAANAVCVPSCVQVFACLVSTPGLIKAHGPLGSVCGFDHSSTFDKAWSEWHNTLYHYPLWQYSTTVRSNPSKVLTLNMEQTTMSCGDVCELRSKVPELAEGGYYVHAVVLWTVALGRTGADIGGRDVKIWDEKGPGQEPSAWSERAVKFLEEPLLVPSGGGTAVTAVVDVKVELVDVAERASAGGGGVLSVMTSNARVIEA